MTPPALDRVVKKCLAKDPDERWQAASDLCDELKWIAEGGSQAGARLATASNGIRALGRRALIAGLAHSCSLVAVAQRLAIWNLKPSPNPRRSPSLALYITLPPGQHLAGAWMTQARRGPFSRWHSSRVRRHARQRHQQQIYLRAMDSLEARPISGTEGGCRTLLLSRRPMDRFFRRRKAEEGLGERGSGADARRCWRKPRGASWSSQGTYRLRTRGGLDPHPASVGRGRHATAADSSRKRGSQPDAGRSSCPAVRQCSLLLARIMPIGRTLKSPSSRSERANGETWSKVGCTPATRPPGI